MHGTLQGKIAQTQFDKKERKVYNKDRYTCTNYRKEGKIWQNGQKE